MNKMRTKKADVNTYPSIPLDACSEGTAFSTPYILRETPSFLARALAPAMIEDLGNGRRTHRGDRMSEYFLIAREREKLYKTRLRGIMVALVERSKGIPASRRHYSIHVDDAISGIDNLYYLVEEPSLDALENALRKIFEGLQEGCLPGMVNPDAAVSSDGPYIVLTDVSDLADALIGDLTKAGLDWRRQSRALAVAQRRDASGVVSVRLEEETWDYSFIVRDEARGQEEVYIATRESLKKELGKILNSLKRGKFPGPQFSSPTPEQICMRRLRMDLEKTGA